MFAIPGLLGVLLFLMVRPQDLDPVFSGLPSLQVFALLGAFGLLIDIRRLNVRYYASPQVPFVALFMSWCLLTLIPTRPDTIGGAISKLFIIFVVYLLGAFAVQSFRKLRVVAGFFLAAGLFIAYVASAQGLGDNICFEEDPHSIGDVETLIPDGRPCETYMDCRRDGEPGKRYTCEKLGPFNTSSVAGRVRYVGLLHDPNETSLACAVVAPFALAFLALRRSWSRRLLVLVTLVLVGIATFYSKSRGGQLVFATVFATYLYRRNGIRGLIIAAIMVSPIMLFGGRSGEEAESSSLERLECWHTGMQLWRESPIWGVGVFRFLDHHFLTAHNSYILVIAETGFPGLFLFVALLYSSGKPIVMAMRSLPDGPYSDEARAWALALFASLAGAMVGIFFLSFAYHFVLWVLFALAGAYYGILRAHYPGWDVKITRTDLLIILVVTLNLTAILYVYTTLRAP